MPAASSRAARCVFGTQNFLSGQAVSLFSIGALLMAKRLALRGMVASSLLNLTFYLALAVVYVVLGWCLRPRQDTSKPTTRWWMYAFVALLDAQANVAATKALSFTSFSTTGLMLNLAIPFVFALCVSVMKTPFTRKHVAGCILTLLGGGVLLAGSWSHAKADSNSTDLYGWTLALLGAALYAASNVANQWCLRAYSFESVIQSLGMIGMWGSGICLLQVLLIERHDVVAIQWNGDVLLLFVGYVLAMLAFYTAVFVLVHASETAIYNVSLLLSSLYLVLVSRYLLDEAIGSYEWSAAVLMVVGLAIYAWNRSADSANLPQISFKSLQTPRDEMVMAKMDQAIV
ncbi:hypothetical protein ATCC90586_009640 [Pythium insidiosum]|nr:hypothetical protein ATCC90586_009640 [Pythium insidiosum]